MAYLPAPERLDTLLHGEPRYRADQLRDWLYRTPVLDATAMTNLPAALRSRLADTQFVTSGVRISSAPARAASSMNRRVTGRFTSGSSVAFS